MGNQFKEGEICEGCPFDSPPDNCAELIDKLANCGNCTKGPTPCQLCYGSEPEETRCHPKPGSPFYRAQWEMKE